jgi:hypothetical protein
LFAAHFCSYQLFVFKGKEDVLNSDDEASKFDDENSSSQTSSSLMNNQLLQRGQNLIKTKQKRPFDEPNKVTTNETQSLAPNPIETHNEHKDTYLEKFSFLKKDKTYLNRLSSYVCKTLNSHDGKANSVNVKSDMQKSRNMVFSCLSQATSTVDKMKQASTDKVLCQSPLMCAANHQVILSSKKKRRVYEYKFNCSEPA